MKTSRFHTVALATCCALAFSTIGCSTSSFLKSSGAMIKAPMELISGNSHSQSISKVLCLWEAAEGQSVGGSPSRGFAGQILFFEHGKPSPVKVNGDVVIYQYKDFDPDAEEHQLVHTFRFDAKSWKVHLADGALGESYNVFLPLSEKKKEQVTCALRVELTLDSGRKVSSPFTEVTLGGKKIKVTDSERQSFIRNRQIGGKIEAAVPVEKQTAQQALNTMTIELPKR